MLGDHAHGGQAECAELAQAMIRKHHPGGTIHHIGQFVPEKIKELVSRLMGSPGDREIALGKRPRRGGQDNRETTTTKMAEQGTRWVVDAGEVGQIALTAAQAQ